MHAYRFLALFATVLACVLGCNSNPTPTVKPTSMVVEMVAVKDISAGTTIGDSRELFKSGKMHEKGKEPAGIFLDNWAGLLKGKKVSRALKSGEIVQRGDIVEPDESPFQAPKD